MFVDPINQQIKNELITANANLDDIKVKSQLFTTNGTWTRPSSDVKYVEVTMIGAGGAGGNGGTSGASAGGGGGGGGGAGSYILEYEIPVYGNLSIFCGASVDSYITDGSNELLRAKKGVDGTVGANATAGTNGGAGGVGGAGGGFGQSDSGSGAAATEGTQPIAWIPSYGGSGGGDGGNGSGLGTGAGTNSEDGSFVLKNGAGQTATGAAYYGGPGGGGAGSPFGIGGDGAAAAAGGNSGNDGSGPTGFGAGGGGGSGAGSGAGGIGTGGVASGGFVLVKWIEQ